jgi:hypothetical protein
MPILSMYVSSKCLEILKSTGAISAKHTMKKAAHEL